MESLVKAMVMVYVKAICGEVWVFFNLGLAEVAKGAQGWIKNH